MGKLRIMSNNVWCCGKNQPWWIERGLDCSSAVRAPQFAKVYKDINDATRIFDCSGLVTYHLMKLGILKSDTTANGLYKWCKPITKKELKKGDLVFKVTDGKAVHVAVYIGDNKLVECVGRDEGCKNTELTTKFNKYGKIPLFE